MPKHAHFYAAIPGTKVTQPNARGDWDRATVEQVLDDKECVLSYGGTWKIHTLAELNLRPATPYEVLRRAYAVHVGWERRNWCSWCKKPKDRFLGRLLCRKHDLVRL